MITIEALNNYGADTKEGLTRCMNNEAFYLRLVGMGLADPNFEKLSQAVSAGDAKAAFESAHALKGIVGNLSLTPLYKPVAELTDLLRGKEEMPDTSPYLEQIMDQYEKLRALNS